ncbi:hypothetical protein EMPS_00099 [Entomortierella parvispora]|uniref:Uncharacterized protein n=1 Tax=Entomortierella parvispora TaxID=205924 RepID=A0A9P3H137_9FUNG|nr:hypothetical protein EMPS_00099 [Entomortierella parvispora]
MPYLSAQDALMQAKTNTEGVRKARGSEFEVMKHYRAAKKALTNVDVMRTDPTHLEEMIVVFLDLAAALDHAGKQFQEKATKCRLQADPLRQLRDERMRFYAATIAPSLMGAGFSTAIAQAGINYRSSSAATINSASTATFCSTSTETMSSAASAPQYLPTLSSQAAVSIVVGTVDSGSPSFFSENVVPEFPFFPLPSKGESLGSTRQLAYCLALLQPSLQDDKLPPDELKWRLNTLNDSEEKERLERLSVQVIQSFAKDIMKNATAIAEVIHLAPVLN